MPDNIKFVKKKVLTIHKRIGGLAITVENTLVIEMQCLCGCGQTVLIQITEDQARKLAVDIPRLYAASARADNRANN